MKSNSKILFCKYGSDVQSDIEDLKQNILDVEIDHCEYIDQLYEMIQKFRNDIQLVITAPALPGEGNKRGGNIFQNREKICIYSQLLQHNIPVIVLSDTISTPLKKKKEKVESDGNTWILKKEDSLLELVQEVKRIVDALEKEED